VKPLFRKKTESTFSSLSSGRGNVLDSSVHVTLIYYNFTSTVIFEKDKKWLKMLASRVQKIFSLAGFTRTKIAFLHWRTIWFTHNKLKCSILIVFFSSIMYLACNKWWFLIRKPTSIWFEPQHCGNWKLWILNYNSAAWHFRYFMTISSHSLLQ